MSYKKLQWQLSLSLSATTFSKPLWKCNAVYSTVITALHLAIKQTQLFYSKTVVFAFPLFIVSRASSSKGACILYCPSVRHYRHHCHHHHHHHLSCFSVAREEDRKILLCTSRLKVEINEGDFFCALASFRDELWELL